MDHITRAWQLHSVNRASAVSDRAQLARHRVTRTGSGQTFAASGRLDLLSSGRARGAETRGKRTAGETYSDVSPRYLENMPQQFDKPRALPRVNARGTPLLSPPLPGPNPFFYSSRTRYRRRVLGTDHRYNFPIRRCNVKRPPENLLLSSLPSPPPATSLGAVSPREGESSRRFFRSPPPLLCPEGTAEAAIQLGKAAILIVN